MLAAERKEKKEKKERKEKKEKKKEKKEKPKKKFELFGQLPPELQLEVLSHLSVSSLVAVSSVCKSLHLLTQTESLWKNLSVRYGIPHFLKPEATSWQAFFRQFYSNKTLFIHNNDTTDMYFVARRLQNHLKVSIDYSRALTLKAHSGDVCAIFQGPLSECDRLCREIGRNAPEFRMSAKDGVPIFNVFVSRNNWFKIASTEHWENFLSIRNELGFKPKHVSSYSYPMHAPPQVLIYQGPHEKALKFTKGMNEAFKPLSPEPIFTIEFINQQLGSTEKQYSSNSIVGHIVNDMQGMRVALRNISIARGSPHSQDNRALLDSDSDLAEGWVGEEEESDFD